MKSLNKKEMNGKNERRTKTTIGEAEDEFLFIRFFGFILRRYCQVFSVSFSVTQSKKRHKQIITTDVGIMETTLVEKVSEGAFKRVFFTIGSAYSVCVRLLSNFSLIRCRASAHHLHRIEFELCCLCFEQ